MNAADSAHLILGNYRRLFGRDLVDQSDPSRAIETLFNAPRAVLSALGPIGSDHLFNYANRTALETGRRFRIVNATVFNLLDETGHHLGQAATFENWQPI